MHSAIYADKKSNANTMNVYATSMRQDSRLEMEKGTVPKTQLVRILAAAYFPTPGLYRGAMCNQFTQTMAAYFPTPGLNRGAMRN